MLVKIDPQSGNDLEEAEVMSFASLPFNGDSNAREEHLEDLIAENASVIESANGDDSGESLLIIGRQVRTTTSKRMDLVALDGSGVLILIEVKRDAEDMKHRKDHAEIQAVRYAAGLAKLRSVDDIVTNLYGPYIARYQASELEREGGKRTAEEWARKKILEFMRDNDIDRDRLNHDQRIVLIGASFDEDTKSAAAWMARNGMPIRLIEVQPVRVGDCYFLNITQVLPVSLYEDYYVDVVTKEDGRKSALKSMPSGITRTARIRLDAIIEAGLVGIGDEIYFKKQPDNLAVIVDGRRCRYKGRELSILQWSKELTGWGAVNIYEWIVHVPSGQLLDDLRVTLEQQLEADTISSDATDDDSNSQPDQVADSIGIE